MLTPRRNVRSSHDEPIVADVLAQRLGRAQRLVHRAALEQHAELVAAEPRERIAPTDLRLQQRADLLQQRVAGIVAAGIVDDLELIEVEVENRVRRFARLGALQRALETLLELAAVDELGQHVVAGRIAQAPVQLARLADVVKHEHAARDAAERIADRRRRALDVELVAVATDQQRGPHGLDGAVAAHRDADGVLDRLARLLVEAAEDLVDGAADGVVEPPTRELGRHGIQILHARLGVRRHDAVADRLQRDLRALLLAEQRFLVELAFGDVGLDADQPLQAAVVVEPALNAALDPAPLAARVLHAMHALEQLGPALEMLAQLRLDVREIVGMHEQPPFGHVVVVRVAEHRAPTRREIHRVLAHVVIPQPVVGRVGHEAIALLNVGQILRELDALEAARAARAEQLQSELQLGRPFGIRRGAADRQQCRRVGRECRSPTRTNAPTFKLASRCGIVLLSSGRFGRILDLEQPQMPEPRS